MDKNNFTLKLERDGHHFKFVVHDGEMMLVEEDGLEASIEQESSPEMYCLVRTVAELKGIY